MLWRTTNDTRWRERGWAMFEAIEEHARTNDSYASVFDVNVIPAVALNDLPSFFFAETCVLYHCSDYSLTYIRKTDSNTRS